MFEDPISVNSQDILAARVRIKRNQILQNTVDRVNPVRYQTLTQQQQTELSQYRQALLDITQQPGFPENVVWPTNPPWLP